MLPKIYIGRLSQDTSEKEISDCFSKIGRVISVELVKSINGKDNAGYGYVRMSNSREVNEAIKTLNNSKLKGNKITVIEAHSMDQDNWHIPYRFIKRKWR